jgi:DNA repair protein RecN (Recombination protein N)
VLGKKESELAALAGDLSKKRKGIAGRIEQLTVDELKQLGFQKALFCISLHTKEHVDENGIDDVEFLFSANPGEPPKPLIRVASGGELSRIMLALKCVEIQQGAKDKGHDAKMASHAPATLIFDEIDAGIGGVTAQHVGHRLRRITGDYQVLCVSHLPQIAALAENHLMVEKQLEKGGVLVTASYLDEDLRQKEIARMLSGNVTGTSLKHARELLHYGSIKSQVP